MEKPKLRIVYRMTRGRRGLDRKRYEEYIVGFKFNTPEEREAFKESVKAWYYEGDEPDEIEKVEKPAKKAGRPKKVVVGPDV